MEWFVPRPDGPPARLSNEVHVAPFGHDLLVTWEPGHRVRMAKAAQKPGRTCWAEWNLADGTVEPSLGLDYLLGLGRTDPVPDLRGLASLVAADSLPEFCGLLYDVLLRKRSSSRELRMRGPVQRFIRMVAEPVRPKAGPVWALRAVLIDVSDDHRRRALARAADEEARRQRSRAAALTEVADVLRDAVLPRFQDALAPASSTCSTAPIAPTTPLFSPCAASLRHGAPRARAVRTPPPRTPYPKGFMGISSGLQWLGGESAA